MMSAPSTITPNDSKQTTDATSPTISTVPNLTPSTLPSSTSQPLTPSQAQPPTTSLTSPKQEPTLAVSASKPPPIPKSTIAAKSPVHHKTTTLSKSVVKKELTTTRPTVASKAPISSKSNTKLSAPSKKKTTIPSTTDLKKSTSATKPSPELRSLEAVEKSISKIADNLRKRLKDLETDIDRKEDDYINKTWAHGNVMRGWDGFIRRIDRPEKVPTGNGAGIATGAPKTRKTRPSDRFFSLSSSTSKYRRDNPEIAIQKRTVPMKKKRKR